MDTTAIKKELHEYIDSADENILAAIYEILKGVETAGDFELSEEHKQLLDERLHAYYTNPNDVLTWEEVKAKYVKE